MPLVDQGGCVHRQEPARHKQEGLHILVFFSKYALNSLRSFICVLICSRYLFQLLFSTNLSLYVHCFRTRT